jgi:hypothetical protein
MQHNELPLCFYCYYNLLNVNLVWLQHSSKKFYNVQVLIINIYSIREKRKTIEK